MLAWEVTLHPCTPASVGKDPIEMVRTSYVKLELNEFCTRMRSADAANTQVPMIFANRISTILAGRDLSSPADRKSMILANRYSTVLPTGMRRKSST